MHVRQIRLVGGSEVCFRLSLRHSSFRTPYAGHDWLGGRLRTRTGHQMWDLNAEEFLAEFEWAFENEIAAHVEAISTGEDFKIYIEKKPR